MCEYILEDIKEVSFKTNKELLELLKKVLPNYKICSGQAIVIHDEDKEEFITEIGSYDWSEFPAYNTMQWTDYVSRDIIIKLIPLLFDKFECHNEMAKYVFSSYRKVSVADYKLYEYFFADKKESAWILFDYEGVIQDLIKTIKEYYDNR